MAILRDWIFEEDSYWSYDKKDLRKMFGEEIEINQKNIERVLLRNYYGVNNSGTLFYLNYRLKKKYLDKEQCKNLDKIRNNISTNHLYPAEDVIELLLIADYIKNKKFNFNLIKPLLEWLKELRTESEEITEYYKIRSKDVH